MNEIKNIVFDLGGVLMNIDFKRTFDAFEIIGFHGAEQAFHDPDINRLCMDFETGVYCSIEMRRKFREMTGFKCTDIQFDKAWNALLIDFPPERIMRVQQLAKKYKTYLLSNTNPIHAKHFNAELDKHFGIESMDHLLDKAWYSYNLGMRKPDERIYHKVLKASRLDPAETLYVDDYESNVRIAESIGLHGIYITDQFTIMEALADF
ncbi:MAG: HAD family phosphatase [Porphyromonadaceae bacterium]|nr:MAG: HAD family phosphatase [Porphyromonadaceae bacterium]